VFLGVDTMLRAPVTLGDGAKTGAGAVVTRDVPPGKLAVGVPARIRDPRPVEPGPSDPASDGRSPAVEPPPRAPAAAAPSPAPIGEPEPPAAAGAATSDPR
jgi:hypothetical protein